MTPATITLILNIVLYVLIGLTILKGLLGLAKGLWKSLASVIIAAIFYAIIIIFNAKFTVLYYGIDLSNLNATLTINDTAIAVQTLGQTMRDALIVLAGESSGLTHESEVFVVFDEMAISMLSLIVFILHFLVTCFILVPIFSTIFYHTIFKHIIGRRLAEKRKVRAGGMAVSFVKAVVSVSLFIMPFSALCNQVSDSVSQREFDDNENTQLFKEYVDAYSSSYLAKAITTVKVGDNTLDVAFTNYITSVQIGDDTTSFFQEMSTFLDIACDAIEQGVINVSDFTVNYAALFSKEFVVVALQKLASSKLVTTLLPVALSIVSNLEQIKSYVDLTEIDWNQINWGNELTAIGDVYSAFYDAGVIDSFVINPSQMQDFVFTRDTYSTMKQGFETLSTSDALSQVLPYAMASFGKYLDEKTDVKGVLPTEPEGYDGVNLGEELLTFYDSVLTLSDLAITSPLGRNLTVGDFQNDNVKIAVDYVLSEDAVMGNGEVTPSTSDGYDIITYSIFDGVKDKTGRYVYKGMLDSKLITDNFDSLVKYFASLDQVESFGISDTLIQESETMTTDDWRREIFNVLSIAPIVYNNPNLDLNNLDIYSETTVAELKKLEDPINNSKLINKLADPLFRTYMKDAELPYGLDVDDFTFDVPNLGTEIVNLLDVLPAIGRVQNALENKNGADAFYGDGAIKVNDVRLVLTNVYNSSIVNHEVEDGLTTFETIIYNVFSEQSFVDMGFEITEEDLIDIRNSTPANGRKGAKNDGWTNEINVLCNALESMASCESLKDLINAASNNQTINIADVNADDVCDVFTDFAESKLISGSLANIMNTMLGPSLDELGLSVDFRCVESWGDEFQDLKLIIKDVQKLQKSQIDLQNLDVASLGNVVEIDEEGNEVTGVDVLSDLLHSVYKLDCITREYSEEDGTSYQSNKPFGDFLYKNVTENVFNEFLSDIDEDKKNEILHDHYLEYTYTKDGNTLSVPAPNTSSFDFVEWDGEDGEINRVVDLIRFVIEASDEEGNPQFFNVDENGKKTLDIKKSLDDADAIGGLLEDINKIYIFRTVLVEVLDSTLSDSTSSISVEGLHVDYINIDYLNDGCSMDCYVNDTPLIPNRAAEINARQKEIDSIKEIVSDFSTLNDQFKDPETGEWKLELNTISGELDTVEEMVNTMAESYIFNTTNDSTHVTFFQDLMIYLMNESTLADLISENGVDSKVTATKAVTAINNPSPTSYANEWLYDENGNSGEISHFIEALRTICDSDLADCFSGEGDISESLMSLENPGDEISDIILSCSKSRLINYNETGLGIMLDKKLESVFDYDTLNLRVQFKRVSDWESESVTLGNLINAVKSISGDSTTLKIDIDIATVSKADLNEVLVDIYDLQAVQNAVISEETMEVDTYNYANFIYKTVTENGFATFTEGNEEVIKQDHKFVSVNTEGYSWLDVDNGETITKGEISRICDILDVIQAKDASDNYLYLKEVDSSYQVDFDKLTENGDNLNSLLQKVNQLYIYRTLFSKMISKSLNDNTSLSSNELGVNTNKIYADIFENELNYKNLSLRDESVTTREEEITARSEEINSICDVYTKLLDLSLDDVQLENLSDGDTIDNLFDLLETLCESRVFNYKTSLTEGETYPTTFFEDCIVKMLVRSDMAGMMNPNDPATYSDERFAEEAVVSVRNSLGTMTWLDKNEVKGELSLLKQAISSSSKTADVFIGETDLKSVTLDGSKVENAILDASKSHVLNYENSLGTILNKKVAPAFDSVELNMNFANVGKEEATREEEWEKEAKNFNALITSVQDYTGGGFDFSVDIDSISMEQIDKLEVVLDNLHDLRVVQCNLAKDGVNDNYGYFVYHDITNEVFATYINDTNRSDVLLDHNLDSNNRVYSVNEGKTTYVTWTNKEGAYTGENHNLMIMIKFAKQNLTNSEGKIDTNLISDLGDNLGEALEDVNSIHAFRTVLSSVIEEQLTNRATESDKIKMGDNVDKELFQRDYNYLKTGTYVTSRSAEIALRQKELDLDACIINNVDELNTASLAIADITQDTVDTLTETLLFVHNSAMFNSPVARAKNGTTLFDDIVYTSLEESTIKDIIYDEKEAYDDAYSSSEEKTKAIIQQVNNSTEVTWSNDYETLEELTSSTNIEKTTLGNFHKLLSDVVNLEDESGNRVILNNVIDASSLTGDQQRLLLKDMNKCYLSHDGVSRVVKDVLADIMNVEDLLVDKTINPVEGHYNDILIDNKAGSFADKVDIWTPDIDHLINLYDNLDEIGGFNNAITSNEDSDINNQVFIKVLPDLGRSTTLTLQRSDIIYSMFKKAGVNKYISEYGDASTSDLKKRDLIDYLVKRYVDVNDSWEEESNALDDLVNVMIDNKNIDVSSETGITTSTVHSIFATTYVYSVNEEASSALEFEAQYERHYFASELVASFIEDLSKNADPSINFNIGSSSYFRDGVNNDTYSYKGLNAFEENGFAGLIDFVDCLSSYYDAINTKTKFASFQAWEDSFKASLSAMGDKDLLAQRAYYLGENNYNSIIATRLFEVKSQGIVDNINSLLGGLYTLTITAPGDGVSFYEAGYTGYINDSSEAIPSWFSQLQTIYNLRCA